MSRSESSKTFLSDKDNNTVGEPGGKTSQITNNEISEKSAENPETGGGSWPSLTNSVNNDNSSLSGSTPTGPKHPPEENEKLASAVRRVRRSDLANRAMSVHPNRRLREEAVREKRDGGYKARTVGETSKEFLKWLNEQEGSQMVFEKEGTEVKANLPTSYTEEYADKQYGTLKDIERTFRGVTRNPETAMLTLTQSSLNANGNFRAPGDHLRELQESWTDSDYHALRNLMRSEGYELLTKSSIPPGPEPEELGPEHLPSKWWTFAVVLEPHKSGFLHLHVAVFMEAGPDEGLEPGDFGNVLETHLSRLDGAGPGAHTTDKAASVNRLDGDVDLPEESGGTADRPVENLASYISEYIAGYGEPVEERSAEEIAAFSAIWATGSQRVRFGNGANGLADIGQRIRDGPPNEGNTEWSVKEIERPNGETHPPAEVSGGAVFFEIDGAPSADPVKTFGPPGIG